MRATSSSSFDGLLPPDFGQAEGGDLARAGSGPSIAAQVVVYHRDTDSVVLHRLRGRVSRQPSFKARVIRTGGSLRRFLWRERGGSTINNPLSRKGRRMEVKHHTIGTPTDNAERNLPGQPDVDFPFNVVPFSRPTQPQDELFKRGRISGCVLEPRQEVEGLA